jgi:diamine N-acetyltransferase
VIEQQAVFFRRLKPDDLDALVMYLNQLSAETCKRFGPHLFDKQSLTAVYEQVDTYRGYIGLDTETADIVAYSVIKRGYVERDGLRFAGYGLPLNSETDCTFAPSVADAWQGQGLGNKLFQLILSDLQAMPIKRIVLWGGVQADNDRAVRYYRKHQFEVVGEFERNGPNYDMVLTLNL